MSIKNALIHGLLTSTIASFSGMSQAVDLLLKKVKPVTPEELEATLPDQLPMSRTSAGSNDIKIAWLAKPTARYQHAVLGDGLEAAQLLRRTVINRRPEVIAQGCSLK